LGVLVGGIVESDGKTSDPATDEADEFRKAVEEIFDTYSDAIMKADADTWIGLWDEKGIMMSPNSPAVVGKRAIAERKRRGNERRIVVSQIINIEETQVSGNLGFGRGTYTEIVQSRAGGATENIDGKFLTVFKKQADGSWKIYRDCYNSNVALE